MIKEYPQSHISDYTLFYNQFLILSKREISVKDYWFTKDNYKEL